MGQFSFSRLQGKCQQTKSYREKKKNLKIKEKSRKLERKSKFNVKK